MKTEKLVLCSSGSVHKQSEVWFLERFYLLNEVNNWVSIEKKKSLFFGILFIIISCAEHNKFSVKKSGLWHKQLLHS